MKFLRKSTYKEKEITSSQLQRLICKEPAQLILVRAADGGTSKGHMVEKLVISQAKTRREKRLKFSSLLKGYDFQ